MNPQIWAAIIAATAGIISPIIIKIYEAAVNKINKKRNKLNEDEITRKSVADLGADMGARLDHLGSKLSGVEIEQKRYSLMLLLSDYPDSVDIPRLAEEYVKDLGGNSYLLPILVDWYNKKFPHNLPEWLINSCIEHHISYK